MIEVEVFLAAQNRLGEGPRWNPQDGLLYWVDIEGNCFYRCDRDARSPERIEIGIPLGVLAFRPGGGLVLATRDGFAFWDGPGSPMSFVADPEPGKPDARFNDGGVDRQGRFWAGTMTPQGFTSALYRLDPDGSLHTMATEIGVANGIGWSLDNRTMYFTDSPRQVIYAYDFDPATGAIFNRRPFIDSHDEPGVPDGLVVDSAGGIWSARWGGWKITHYDPQGRAVEEVRVPVEYPTACTFGGPNLDELYITSAWTPLSAEQRSAQPQAGDLFRCAPGVTGLPEPLFGG